MKSADKKIDPLLESFESEGAAGEFWDTHSLADYEEHLEAADDVRFEIQRARIRSSDRGGRIQKATRTCRFASSAAAEGC